jgi:uncharacterized membrane protein YsdA (DUF1294 family)
MSPVLAVIAVFFALLVGLVGADALPVTLLAAYGLLSLIAFAMYGEDKSAAEQRRWRTPESALHTIALVGGWPGALIARRYFHHKTRKQPFRSVFWITVLTNCVALGWFIYETPVQLP